MGTLEQRAAFDFMRRLGEPFRLRVKPDVEGWPIIPGRYGQIEWVDEEQIAVFTDRRLIRSRLLAVPGVRPHQVGDTELRALAPPEALETLAGITQARKRRIVTEAQRQKLAEIGYRVTPEGQSGGSNPEAILSRGPGNGAAANRPGGAR